MAKPIRRGQSPVTTYMPTSHFNMKSEAFDNLIEKMGYKVRILKSTLCPCALSDENHAQASCVNCRGLGYIYYNPIETRAIITSLNYRSKTHEWTVENIGTASITTYENNELSLNDKVQILDTYSRFSQLITAEASGGIVYSYLTYKPEEIYEVFKYIDTSMKLELIDPSQYELTDYGIKWLDFNFNHQRFSVRYKHLLEYIVIDLPHNMRQSTYKEFSGDIVQDDFPVMGVGRIAHFALDMPDWNGEKLVNNDTE